MSQQQLPTPPSYKIYGTLLDSFQWYLDSQSEDAFKELIDKINRVPFSSEAADKGTAFNEVVDLYLKGNIELHPSGLFLHNGFGFEEALVAEFARHLAGATSQVRLSADLPTRYGIVELYGVLDEMLHGTIVDIKTTKSYTFPKFLKAWQHIAYPYIARMITGMDMGFVYMITDFREIYTEDYDYDHNRDRIRLTGFVEEFIEFLEAHQHLITDKKVFSLDYEVSMLATPTPNAIIIESVKS